MNKNIVKNKSFKVMITLSCLLALSANQVSACFFDSLVSKFSRNKTVAKVVGFTALGASIIGLTSFVTAKSVKFFNDKKAAIEKNKILVEISWLKNQITLLKADNERITKISKDRSRCVKCFFGLKILADFRINKQKQEILNLQDQVEELGRQLHVLEGSYIPQEEDSFDSASTWQDDENLDASERDILGKALPGFFMVTADE